MTKFQVHTATDETAFQHRAAPGRTRNGHPSWLWTVLGMARDKRFVIVQEHNLVTMMPGLNLQHSGGWQIVEEHATFDFRLREVAIYFIAEVGMGTEEMWTCRQAKPHPLPFSLHLDKLWTR